MFGDGCAIIQPERVEIVVLRKGVPVVEAVGERGGLHEAGLRLIKSVLSTVSIYPQTSLAPRTVR